MATGAFVGRRDELGVLTGALADAMAGSPGTVVVTGEAGIGKSRLVAEFTRRAREAGAQVLVGACLPIGADLPLTAITEALRGLVEAVGIDAVRRAAGPMARVLRRVVPALGPVPDGDGDAAFVQGQLFEAVLGLLGRVSTTWPLVLVVEDVHWADGSTRDLLLHLAHNLRGCRVLLVVTCREDEVGTDHPLRPVLHRLRREPTTRTVALAALDDADVAVLLESLLAAPPRRDELEQVARRANGSPFFVEELVAAARDGAPWTETLRDALLLTVDALPSATRELLQVAAAAGRRVPHRLLCLAAGRPDEEVDRDLRPALDRRVLVADDRVGAYAFRHELFAEVLASLLSPAARQRVHRRLAEALEAEPELSTGAPAAELAHHWDRAGERARAWTASLAAARESERLHAMPEAFVHLERLVSLWDAAPVDADLDRVDALRWLGRVAQSAGHGRRGLEVARLAREAVDPTDTRRVAQVLVELSEHLTLAARRTAAEEAALAALEVAPADPPTPERAAALLRLVECRIVRDPVDVRPLAQDALETAVRAGAPPATVVASRLGLGACDVLVGRVREGLAALEEGRVEAEQLGDPTVVADAYNLTSNVLIHAGRADAGADAALHGLRRVRELGIDHGFGPPMAGNATSGLFLAGRWDEAAALLAERAGDGGGNAWLLLLQARLLAHRGEHEAAARTLADAEAHGGRGDPRWRGVAIGVTLLRGDHARAAELARETVDDQTPRAAAQANDLVAWAVRALVDAVEAGVADIDQARTLADVFVARRRLDGAAGTVYVLPREKVARAERARLEDGAPVEAWREALAAWERVGWPYPIAYCRHRLAEALVLAGDEGEPVDLLAAAHATATTLGAAPLRRDVERLGRRVGRRFGARSADPDGVLTSREQEVLELVVAGASNPEIGAALHISRKTASVHVSNILRKLEVASRTEAAAVAVRDGLVGVDGVRRGSRPAPG